MSSTSTDGAGAVATGTDQALAQTDPTPSARTSLAAVLRRLPSVQRGLLDDAVGGIASVAGGVRDSVLQTVAGWARRMPGYELLCAILGRDVVAGTPVPRSAAAIINGFLGLMPRGDALRQQLQESGAIDRAGAWFEQEIPRLGLTWDAIRGLFTRAWDALSATDLLDPEGAWRRISGIFGPPLARLRDFAVGAVTKVAEFVFEGAMTMAGGLGTQVLGIIRRAGEVLHRILRDPVGFAGNLVAAVRGGLGAFLSNIATHLRTGLIGWLTGALGGAIHLPARLDLRGILGLAMEFLGLTWANIRGRITRVIGDRAMGLLERGAGIVHDVAEHGIGALTARIAQFTSGLVDTVLGGIRDWVTNSVVGAAITRLISMFNPAGAVIQAIIAVYNTVQFFLERAQQLGALANSVFDSIAAIASGSIGNAVSAVENALGRAVPVVLGFLARLIGLGDVATPVRNVMGRVRTVVDSAIDRVVGWIAGMARRVGGALRSGATRVLGNARAAVRAGAARTRDWLGLRQQFSGADGSTHTLYWERSGGSGVLTMASTPAPVERVLQSIQSRVAADPQLLAKWNAADAQRVVVNGLKARVTVAGPNGRQPADVDALNSAMRILADRMRELEPVISPTAVPAGGAMPTWVVPGALARIKSSRQIATVIAMERHESGTPLARYIVTDPRNPQSAAVQRGQSNVVGGAVAGNHVARLWEQVESRIARLFYMGDNPRKTDPVGAAVEARMRAERLPDGLGKIVGSQVRSMRDADDKPLPPGAPPRLVPLADCEMGHVVDAVHWWNTEGRFTGARSGEVRRFMTDPANYEFEPRDVNQLRGRRQAALGIRYLPSMKVT